MSSFGRSSSAKGLTALVKQFERGLNDYGPIPHDASSFGRSWADTDAAALVDDGSQQEANFAIRAGCSTGPLARDLQTTEAEACCGAMRSECRSWELRLRLV